MTRFDQDRLNQLITSNQDLHGRKFTGAGSATVDSDYTTLKNVKDLLIGSINKKFIIGIFKQLLKLPLSIFGTLSFQNLTALKPLKLNTNKQVISAAIDLTNDEEVTGSTDTQIPVGNATGSLAFGSTLTYDPAIPQFAIGGTPWASSNFWLHITTDENIGIRGAADLSSGITIDILDDAISANLGLSVHASEIILVCPKMGFFSATPASKQTLNAYTSDSESGAYSGIATGIGGSPYASVADLNTLRVAYENLRASYDDLRTKLQTTTLVG